MQKRLLAFAVMLACAGATVVGRTAAKPAIHLTPSDDGVLVSVVTTALSAERSTRLREFRIRLLPSLPGAYIFHHVYNAGEHFSPPSS